MCRLGVAVPELTQEQRRIAIITILAIAVVVIVCLVTLM
jgi:hypothetical protein